MLKSFTFGAFCVAPFLLAGCMQEDTLPAQTDAPATSAPAQVATAAPVATDRNPLLRGPVATSSRSWGGNRGRQFLAAMAHEIDGQVYVCGVKYAEGANPRGLNTTIFNSHGFYIGKTLVSKGFASFATAPTREAVKTTPTTCKSTGKPWKPEYAKGPWHLAFIGTTRF